MRDTAIVGSEDIARMFSVLHDGSITDATAKDGCFSLCIEIRYLAEQIDNSFTYFSVELLSNDDLCSARWRSKNAESARSIADAVDLKRMDIEVLSAAAVDDVVEVHSISHFASPDSGYGTLLLEALRANVTDESGTAWSLENFIKLASRYWIEWEEAARKAREEHGEDRR